MKNNEETQTQGYPEYIMLDPGNHLDSGNEPLSPPPRPPVACFGPYGLWMAAWLIMGADNHQTPCPKRGPSLERYACPAAYFIWKPMRSVYELARVRRHDGWMHRPKLKRWMTVRLNAESGSRFPVFGTGCRMVSMSLRQRRIRSPNMHMAVILRKMTGVSYSKTESILARIL